MLSLLLITALAVQYPAPATKPADTTSSRRPAVAARDTTRAAPVSRTAFHDTMRKLWADHVVYTREVIVSTTAGLPDTAAALQRLLRNQDEIGAAVKPYYGDAASTQLTALLRSHIQLAGRTLVAAKGSQHVMQPTMSMREDGQVASPSPARSDTLKMRSNDTIQIKANAQYPTTTGRGTDTTKVSVAAQTSVGTTTDTLALTTAIAALRANGDSIATLLSSANARNWSKSTLQGGFQMHINLLLQEATAHVKGDWQGSIAAFDASLDHAFQLADVLSEGIMKQFPNRFTNRATTMSSLQ